MRIKSMKTMTTSTKILIKSTTLKWQEIKLSRELLELKRRIEAWSIMATRTKVLEQWSRQERMLEMALSLTLRQCSKEIFYHQAITPRAETVTSWANVTQISRESEKQPESPWLATLVGFRTWIHHIRIWKTFWMTCSQISSSSLQIKLRNSILRIRSERI